MQSANLSGPFRGCLYYALLGLTQATGLAGGYDSGAGDLFFLVEQFVQLFHKSVDVFELAVNRSEADISYFV